MPIVNNNIAGIDIPVWEQLPNAIANSAAGSCIVDDNTRYIYYLISAASFWRYDTFGHTWQQLASPPGGTVAAGTCMRYAAGVGTQRLGKVYGSVYAFQAAGASVTFYRYDIATNVWSAALSVANVPAAWVTDGRLMYPEPALNNWSGGYHGATSLCTVTTSALAAQGATSISVTALPLALPSGAVLNFGTAASPVWAVLTAAAAAAATSITVSALLLQVPSAATAYWYADMYLFGSNAQVVYRYNIAANAWSLTSSNSGTPAIPAVGTAVAAGANVTWLPASGDANALNTFIIVCGGATATIREYNLATNAFSAALVYVPATETFTTGSASGVRTDSNGRPKSVIIQKDNTGRAYEFNRAGLELTPIFTQYLISSGTALVGDRMTVMKYQGIDFAYFIPSTSSYFLRTALVF